jgi:hypothetical protein
VPGAGVITHPPAAVAGLSVKRSPNSQTLKMMLANGSTMTSGGWDARWPC